MYSIIYADVPWFYNSRNLVRKDGKKSRYGVGAAGKYPVMTTDKLCELPIQKLCDDNCALFLWATFPRLEDAMGVISAWGLTYKTVGFVWVKLNPKQCMTPALYVGDPIEYINKLSFFGIGYYSKSNSEVCLLATKGKMKPVSNKVSSMVFSPREKHSKKPDIVRNKIVELFGDLPRIELFARGRADGWDALGYDVGSRDIKTELDTMEIENASTT